MAMDRMVPGADAFWFVVDTPERRGCGSSDLRHFTRTGSPPAGSFALWTDEAMR